MASAWVQVVHYDTKELNRGDVCTVLLYHHVYAVVSIPLS